MEKGPNFNVVGKISEEIKDEIRQENKDKLNRHLEYLSIDRKIEVGEHECSKSPEELECIDLANNETNLLLESAGIEPYEFSAKNIHIMDEYFLKEQLDPDFEAAGRAYAEGQSIVLNDLKARKSKIKFASVVFHEMFHVKSLFVQHAVHKQAEEESSNTKTSTYRKGLLVLPPQQKRENDDHAHFAGLNEAVTAQAEKNFFLKLLENEKFSADREKLFSDEAIRMKSELFEKEGIFPDDILHIDAGKSGEYSAIGYRKQRDVLEYVCNEIAQTFGMGKEEVFKKFVDAQFTGHLVELGKMVEKTFGDGGFRRLSDMPKNNDAGINTLEAMRKMRLSMLKLENNMLF